MMHDPIADLHRVGRVVGRADLDGAPAHVVELRRRVGAPVTEVWDACTRPQRVARQFLPLTGDLHEGGTFALRGNAGGRILRCAPPHRLQLTWEAGQAPPSQVALELRAAGEATDLVLRHTVPDDDRWAQFGPGAVGVGWEGAIGGLVLHLAGGEGPPGDAEAMGAMLRDSAAAWGEAHVAASGDERAAREAAQRTSAFYAPS